MIETVVDIDCLTFLLISIFILGIGILLTRTIPLLRTLNIPAAVSGGLIGCGLVAYVNLCTPWHLRFDLSLRDNLLLIFFSTIGLAARFKQLKEGGKTLFAVIGVMIAFLFLQNAVGIGVACLVGCPPIFGLLGGTIAFVGGHGTAITWGTLLEAQGWTGALEFSLAAATLGLIVGGILAGPISQHLIRRFELESLSPPSDAVATSSVTMPTSLEGMFGIVLLIATSLSVGLGLHLFTLDWGIVLPRFLPIMLVAILLINLLDWGNIPINDSALSFWNDVSLQLFLVMSLMNLQILSWMQTAGPLLIILGIQTLCAGLFAYFVVFWAAGRDYDASVICAGFTGMVLGAMPVGMANMTTITQRYGPSPKALLIIPLLGACCMDIANAVVIQFFLMLSP